MRVYLVQHGEAKPKDVDPERGLTDEGTRNVRAVAAHLEPFHLAVPETWHSGKARARQTAEILAPSLGVSTIIEHDGLAPNDDVEPIAEAIDARGADLLIVGHMPFISRLAGLLVAGESARTVVAFRNAGVVCLEKNVDCWAVAWIVTPDVVSH